MRAILNTQRMIVFVSLFLGIVAFFVSWLITRTYVQNHLLEFDMNAYRYLYIQGIALLKSEGMLEAIYSWVLNNDRNPYQYFVVLTVGALAPATLSTFVLPNLFALLSFVYALAAGAFERTRSLGLTGLSILVFLSSSFLYHPVYGLVDVAPEGSASLFYGAALCCILNSNFGKSTKWMALFGAFASLTALSRYVAVAYIFFSAFPVLIYFILRAYKVDRSVRVLAWPYLASLGMICLLGIPYLIHNFRSVLEFYTTFGYMLGKYTWIDAADFFWRYLKRVFIPDFSFTLLLIPIALAAIGVSRINRERIGIATWFVLSHIVLMIFVLKSVGHTQVPVFVLPALAIFSVVLITPEIVSAGFYPKRYGRLAGALSLVIAIKIVTAIYYVRTQFPDEPDTFNVPFYQKVANSVASAVNDPKITWAGVWAEDFIMPAVISWETHQKQLVSKQIYMTNHLSHWKGFFPDISTDEIPAKTYELISKETQVAVVRKDPEQDNFKFDNEISEQVARYVSRQIRIDPKWKRIDQIDDGPYGPMDVFLRTQ